MKPSGSPDWDKYLNFYPSPSNSHWNADSSDAELWNAGLDENDLQNQFSLDDIGLFGFPSVPNLQGIESTSAPDPAAENPDNRELGEYVDQIQNLDMVCSAGCMY
jgi:hypothetical protein